MAFREQTDEDLGPGAEDLIEKFGRDGAEEIADELGFDLEDVDSVSERRGLATNLVVIEAGSSEWIGTRDGFAEAEAAVKEDLEQEPELFNRSFIQQHLTISPTDRRIIALEDAQSQFEDEFDDPPSFSAGEWDEPASFDHVLEMAVVSVGRDLLNEMEEAVKLAKKLDELESQQQGDIEDEEFERLERDIEAADQALNTQVSTVEALWPGVVESAIGGKAEEIEEELVDPIQFFVEDQGIFSIEDLLDQPFIQIDVDAAAEEAVRIDGPGHFLNPVDGDQRDAAGLEWYQTN